MAAADAARLIGLYLQTRYALRLHGRREVVRIGRALPATLLDWHGDRGALAIVSASNPHSQPFPASENRQRSRALLLRLRETGAAILPGAGYIPEQAWREVSLLVSGLELAQVDALAIGFGQNAVVIAEAGSARLRVYRGDWHAAGLAHPLLQWARGPAA